MVFWKRPDARAEPSPGKALDTTDGWCSRSDWRSSSGRDGSCNICHLPPWGATSTLRLGLGGPSSSTKGVVSLTGPRIVMVRRSETLFGRCRVRACVCVRARAAQTLARNGAEVMFSHCCLLDNGGCACGTGTNALGLPIFLSLPLCSCARAVD